MTRVPIPFTNCPGGAIIQAEVFRESGTDGKIRIYGIRFSEANRKSLQNVLQAVEKLTGHQFSENVGVRFETEYPGLAGESWELMLALGIAAELQNKPLNPKLTGTGKLDRYGYLEKVAGIPEKVQAAKQAGYSVFLVSTSQFEAVSEDGIRVVHVDTLERAWSIAKAIPTWRGYN